MPEPHFNNIKRFYLGEHRGAKRIWLEGNPLEAAGFTSSTRYDRTITPDGTIILEVSDTGAFVVSRKQQDGRDNPVIDMGNRQIDEILDDCVAIEVQYGNGNIKIRRSDVDRMIRSREKRLDTRLKASIPLEAGSLYHGGGILDSGLHEGLASCSLPSHVTVAVEIETEYLETSMRNNCFWAPNAWAVNSPMELTLYDDAHPLKLDILTMGIPCTGASKAGISKNQLDLPEEHKSAGAQFFYALKWIEQTQPSIVVVENVPEYEKTAGWATMRSVIKNLGYDIQTRVFNGAAFGALESRNRMIAVAISHGIQKLMQFDIQKVIPRIEKPKLLRDILDDIPLDSPSWKPLQYLKDKEVRDLADGKGFRMQWLDPDNAATIGTIGRGYAKLRGTEPFVTHPTNPNLARILTPAEHARAKTIPPSIIDGVTSTTVAHEILGQSVIREWFVSLGSRLAGDLMRVRESVRLPSYSEAKLPRSRNSDKGYELF